MKLSPSDLNHLRRLLGYMRCEVGQSPQELVATVQSILSTTRETTSDGKQRLIEAHTKAQNVPKYVRAAIKALEKSLAKEHDIVDGELATRALPIRAPHASGDDVVHRQYTLRSEEPARDPSILWHTPDATKGMSGFCLPGCPACEFLDKQRAVKASEDDRWDDEDPASVIG